MSQDTPVSVAEPVDAEIRSVIKRLKQLRNNPQIPYPEVWAITHIIEDCRDFLHYRNLDRRKLPTGNVCPQTTSR